MRWTILITSLVFAAVLLVVVMSSQAPPSAAQPTSLKTEPQIVGDGTTDNTVAFRQHLKKTGTLDLPRGMYRIRETIDIDLDAIGPIAIRGTGNATIMMSGKGPAFRFLGTHGGTADPTTVKSNVWAKQRTPLVQGIEIVGDHPEADGIEADGTMQLTLTNVVIRKCQHGVHLVKRNRNVLISACHIYENRGVGVYLDRVNLHQINVVGSHISYCQQGGIVSRGGEVRNLQVSGCDIEGNMDPQQAATANILLDSTGGSIAEVAITGCSIQHNSKSPESANIRVLGRGDGGKKLGPTKEGHITIGDNVFSDVRINVDIQNARGVTITGNTFWMGYDYNLKITDSEQIVVGPNMFERNPRYAYGDSETTKNAILMRDCADCTLTGLHVHRVYGTEAAMTLERCRRLNVSNCTLLDCDGIALLCKELTHSRVSGCLIRNDLPDAKGVRSLKEVGCRDTIFSDNVLGNGKE